jgi:hypothetical protein
MILRADGISCGARCHLWYSCRWPVGVLCGQTEAESGVSCPMFGVVFDREMAS